MRLVGERPNPVDRRLRPHQNDGIRSQTVPGDRLIPPSRPMSKFFRNPDVIRPPGLVSPQGPTNPRNFELKFNREQKMKRWMILAYGLTSYAIFLGVFLYAIGFIGNLVVPNAL